MNFNLKDKLYEVNAYINDIMEVCPCCGGGNFGPLQITGKDGKVRQIVCPECGDCGAIVSGYETKYNVHVFELVSHTECLKDKNPHTKEIVTLFKFQMMNHLLAFVIQSTDTKLPENVFYTQEEAEEHIRLIKLGEK